jgi:hypothetical protein
MFVARGVPPLIVAGHVVLLRLVSTLPPAPADTRGTELARVRWTYPDHRVAEPLCAAGSISTTSARASEEAEQFSPF